MSEEKPWNRPWNIEEIVNNAGNWSLAGDAGLLKHLEQFSEIMFAKCENTNNNLNSLVNNLGEASLQLEIAKNQFLSLQNTQFIESRVYEDDETDEEHNINTTEAEETKTDEISVDDLKKVINRGMEIMYTYYDKVEVPASDDEDDDGENPNFILKPKDPYLERPLPYVIGTPEWHKKWHCGLDETSSEDGEENDKKSDDSYSADNSEDDELRSTNEDGDIDTSTRRYSEEFSRAINPPAANSTLYNNNTKQDAVQSNIDDDYVDEENHSYPSQPAIPSSHFTQQLNTKLGNILKSQGHTQSLYDDDEDDNQRPMMKGKTVDPTRYSANIFSDEPPPLDDESRKTNAKPNADLFSGGHGLFDNDEDDDQFAGSDAWSQDARTEGNKITGTENVAEPYVAKGGGLFDSDSDDDLFSTNRIKSESRRDFLTPRANAVTVPFIADEPPELEAPVHKVEADEITKKKPVGGIAPFGNVDLFFDQNRDNDLRNRSKNETNKENKAHTPTVSKEIVFESQTNKASPKQETPDSSVSKVITKTTKQKEQTPSERPEVQTKIGKSVSLFDDDDEDLDDLFKYDFLGGTATGNKKKLTSGIFDISDSDDDFSVNEERANNSNKEAVGKDHVSAKEVVAAQNEDNMEKGKQYDAKKGDDIVASNKADGDSIVAPVQTPEEHPFVNTQNDRLKALFGAEHQPDNLAYLPNKPATFEGEKAKISLFDEDTDDVYYKDNDLFGNVHATANVFFNSQAPPPTISDTNSDEIKRKSENDKRESVETSKIQQPNNGLERDDHLQANDSNYPNSQTVKTEDTNQIPNVNVPTEYYPHHHQIDIFSSSPPPPIDDEWDIQHADDNNSDYDVFEHASNVTNAPFSLFDNEPPSLTFNETSGIVKDSSTTQNGSNCIEKEVSFLPGGSSTRRLSEFTEPFSSDYCVTKSSVANQQDINILRDDVTENVSSYLSDADELFHSEESVRMPTDQRDKLSSNVVQPDEIGNVIDRGSDEGKATALRQSLDEETERTRNSRLPGKLSHNLNINVNALLPGAYTKKNVPLSPERSQEENDGAVPATREDIHPDQPEVLQCVTKNRAKIQTKRRPQSRRGRQEQLRKSGEIVDNHSTLAENNEKSSATSEPTIKTGQNKSPEESFGDFSEDTKPEDLFTSVTKGANSVLTGAASTIITEQVKKIRKSETRTEKQVPKTVSLFSASSDEELFVGKSVTNVLNTVAKDVHQSLFDDNENVNSLFVSASPSSTFSADESKGLGKKVTLDNNILAGDSNEGDLFLSKKEPITRITKTPVEDISSSNKRIPDNAKKGLFSDDDDNEDDDFSLFGGASKTKKTTDVSKDKPNTSIFGQLDDEDALFSKSISANASKKKPITRKSHKSIFGDEDDDDDDADIFRKVTTSKKNDNSAITKGQKRAGNDSIKITKAEPISDDPLSLFKD